MHAQNNFFEDRQWMDYQPEIVFPERDYLTPEEEDYSRMDSFELEQDRLFYTLTKKYRINHYQFAPECILYQGDFPNQLDSIFINLIPDVSYKLSTERWDSNNDCLNLEFKFPAF